MECDRIMDEDGTTTKVTSDRTSWQGGQSVPAAGIISSLSTVRQRLDYMDQERDTFNSKQWTMDESSSSVAQSVSILAIHVLGVRTDMNAQSNKLIAQIQQLMTMFKSLSNQDLPRTQQRPPLARRSSPWQSLFQTI
jgi:hypothetical protein